MRDIFHNFPYAPKAAWPFITNRDDTMRSKGLWRRMSTRRQTFITPCHHYPSDDKHGGSTAPVHSTVQCLTHYVSIIYECRLYCKSRAHIYLLSLGVYCLMEYMPFIFHDLLLVWMNYPPFMMHIRCIILCAVKLDFYIYSSASHS